MSGCFLYASGLGKGSFSCDICAPGLDEPGVPIGIAASGCLGAVGECEEGTVWEGRSLLCRSSAPLSPWSPRVTVMSDARRGAQVGCGYTVTP